MFIFLLFFVAIRCKTDSDLLSLLETGSTMSKASQRKAQLHSDLIDAAEKRIAEHGVTQLRARDLAKDVGCSLGSIYNVFDDLHDLILHTNARTLMAIDEVMAASVAGEGEGPRAIMVNLAWAYFEFAVNHNKPWRGLFDHAFPKDYDSPEWMYEGQLKLLKHIEEPLSETRPNASAEEISLIARTLFSAVHGVVELALDDRTVGLPLEAVRDQLRMLIESFLEGNDA